MEKLRLPPPPPEYMMNPANHDYIKQYVKMPEVLAEINAFVIKIEVERNKMYENLMRILQEPQQSK